MVIWPWADEIEKKYQEWVKGPALFSHPYDEERFYKFVWECINNPQDAPSSNDLRDRLTAEVCAAFPDHISKAADLFITLHDFVKANN